MTRMKRAIAVLAIALAAGYVAVATPEEAQAATTTITADDVGWVQENQPNTTHCGSLANVSNVSGQRQKASFQFPMTSLPAGATITAATLRIYSTVSGGSAGTRLNAFDRNVTAFDGCSIKWATADWAGGGAYGQVLGERVGSVPKNAYVSIPLNLNLSQIATTGRAGIVVTTTQASVFKFQSDIGSNPPRLDLTYNTTPPTTTTVEPTTTTVAPTTTTVEPTTTTVAPTTTTQPPAGGACVSANAVPEYGAANDVGPGREDRDTTGTQATTSNVSSVLASATSGTEVLLRAGTYGTLNVPAGVIVKPYDCEAVQTGVLNLANGTAAQPTTVAGFTAQASSAQYVIPINGSGKHDMLIRNMRVRGGTGEAIRVSGDVTGVTITGSDIDGGQNNHAILIGVGGQSAPYPRNILLSNNYVSKSFYSGSPGEDAVQFQASSEPAVVEHTSFGLVGEEFIDVKSPSSATFRNNLLDNDGPNNNVNLTPGGGCALLTTDATLTFQHNRLIGGQGGCVLEIGGYGIATDPLIEDNEVNDTEVLIRSSNGVVYRNNVQNRGIFALGTTNAGDRPQNLTIGPSNTFNGPGTVKVNSGSTYSCNGNTWTGTWSKQGTLTCTNQPVP